MARHRASRSRRKPARSKAAGRTSRAAPASDTEAALEEIQRVLDTPLRDLMPSAEDRAEVEALAREAAGVPAQIRLRQVVDFVGSARPATQAGNLKAVDAVALARHLGASGDVLEGVRAMDDVPDVAFLFRWAMAAGLVARRGTRIVAGPIARELERDPLAAWLRIASALLEDGPLDGYRRGWRKSYVELLDAMAAGLLAAIAAAGGTVPLVEVQESGWEEVAHHYGYAYDDHSERRAAVRLIGALLHELAELGVLALQRDEVALTGLGRLLVAVLLSDDDDLDHPDVEAG